MDWVIYSLLGAAVLIALLTLAQHHRHSRRDAGQSLELNLDACRTLLMLTAHFQQHRGMSLAWLAGDKGFGSKLESKAREIDGLFQALRPLADSESGKPHPCLTANELSLFRNRWGGLRERLGQLSVEQSIVEHSQLIEQLLRWLAALGEARLEPLVVGRGERNLVRNYATRLPALTECLGQARAVGLSVTTRGSCSAVARVRLLFLIARAESILKQAGEGGATNRKAEHAVQHMVQLLRHRVLGNGGVTVGAQEYFDDATRAVDAIFAWIADNGRVLSDAGIGASARHPAGSYALS